MALLSADDVLNKRFETTKFREGYDQDQVDDFLDEIVTTLRTVYAENEELKEKLAAAEGRVAELADAPEAVEQPAPVVEEPAPVVETAAFAPAPVAEVAPSEQDATRESATSMLALAQRLHDEYVANGREEADRLVAEARNQGDTIVAEANKTRDDTLEQLGNERSALEHKIDELRGFEREYRSRVKSHLDELMATLERGAADN